MTSVKKTAKKAHGKARKAAKEARTKTQVAISLRRKATSEMIPEADALCDVRTAQKRKAETRLYATERAKQVARMGMTGEMLEDYLKMKAREKKQATEGRERRLTEKTLRPPMKERGER